MGRVFAARQVGDAGFERIVALKRVHAHLVSDPEVYAMASDEARLSALLHHPNVVPVIDVVDAKGELVLVMEYVEGVSLAALLRARESKGVAGDLAQPPLALGLASRIVLDALRGLSAAHGARDLAGEPLELVHRDVSPQNLLVGSDGTTRLIDFGIARAEGRLALTKTGVIKGKVVYMAPERLEEAEVDRRADLFSVGAVLYELVAGRWAFGAGDDAAQMSRILLGEIDFDPIRARCAELVPVVERALARSPRERFDDAREFAEALARAIPPATHEEVRDALLATKGAELAARRERLSRAVAEHLAEGADEADLGAPAGAETDDAAIALAPRAPPVERRPSRFRLAFGVGALVLNAAGWYVMTRGGGGSTAPAEVAAAPSPQPSASSAPSASPSAVADVVDVVASSRGAPSSAPVASASAPAAITTPRAGGLEPSPYGAGLRKSPYKRP